MNTLRKMKKLTLHSLLPPALAIAGLAGINSPAQAACYGYPESTGCTIMNPVTGASTTGTCVGNLATGNIIIAPSFCTNPAGSDLPSGACVIRGLGGADLVTPASNGFSMILACGGGGNDQIMGGSDNDVLLGEAGNDFISGGGGTNLVQGGTENDTLLVGGSGFSAHNFNDGGTGKNVCQKGQNGANAPGTCFIKLP